MCMKPVHTIHIHFRGPWDTSNELEIKPFSHLATQRLPYKWGMTVDAPVIGVYRPHIPASKPDEQQQFTSVQG